MKGKNSKIIFQFLVLLVIIVSVPLSVMLLGRETEFVNKAALEISGKNADLKINLSTSKNFTPNWQYFSQGGESSDGMLAPAISSMKKIKPRYVRIDHVFDFYNVVSRTDGGQLFYNWSDLDKEIGEIVKMGARPFVSLSYMPMTISSGNNVAAPSDWGEWSEVVKAAVEHISGKNSLAISEVYYEVWNEPDLFGGFKLRGEKNYLELYRYSSYGVQSAKNVLPFKFGGPATTSLYKSWVFDLLTFVEKNNLRMDFYSWHKYSGFLSDYDKDITNIYEWKNQLPRFANLELIITESGHTPEIDEGYDTKFSAMQTLAQLAANTGAVDKVFTFEVIDGVGEKKKWGRWGLLTNEKWGVPEEKIRFKAFEFLNQMDVPGLLAETDGQGDFVKSFTVLGGNSIKIFLVNYDPSGKHFERVPVQITGINGEYNYRYSEFMGESYEFPLKIENVWNTHLFMKPNSAVIVELVPAFSN